MPKHKKLILFEDSPLVELYSPMYRLVKYRTTTAATLKIPEASLNSLNGQYYYSGTEHL